MDARFEFTGIVLMASDIETGQGNNGEWRKRTVVFFQEGSKYPKNIAVTFFGDKVDIPVNKGDLMNVYLNVDSRENNGRWYTNLNVWKCEPADGGSQSDQTKQEYAPKQQPQQSQAQMKPASAASVSSADEDNLPF